MQYGRLINYWHCEIISLTNPSAPCDCEKVLQSIPADNDHPMTATLNKDKMEEVNIFLENNTEKYFKEVRQNINSPVIKILFSAEYPSVIFQPPRA
jgi:hypothetical protein